MFHHVINYQHVSVALAIISGVALQEFKEYNNLPHGISGTLHLEMHKPIIQPLVYTSFRDAICCDFVSTVPVL
jgi:hypothetical protein